MIEATVPALPSINLEDTVAFYERLGFQVARRYDDYVVVARDGCELHFYIFPDIDPLANYTGCYIRVDDPDALHAEFTRAGINRLGQLIDQRWGMREFTVVDPNGSLLRFGLRVSPYPPPSGS